LAGQEEMKARMKADAKVWLQMRERREAEGIPGEDIGHMKSLLRK
jgi:hypothetical protein